MLGLGKNVPIAMGNGSDSILPFVDGKFVTLRLPYPSGLFPKNVDGRIDDEGAGWKGRGDLDHVGVADQLPPRRRQGEPAEGDQAAAAAGSAGAVVVAYAVSRATTRG